MLLDEELSEALGCEAYQRVEGRRGYRNGAEQRTLTTEIGIREVRVPRGRLVQDDGRTAEFRSELLPRYARRTKVINEAILGIYLAGANSDSLCPRSLLPRPRAALRPPSAVQQTRSSSSASTRDP